MYIGDWGSFGGLELWKLVLCQFGWRCAVQVFSDMGYWRSGTGGAEFRKTTEAASLFGRDLVKWVSGGVTSGNWDFGDGGLKQVMWYKSASLCFLRKLG